MMPFGSDYLHVLLASLAISTLYLGPWYAVWRLTNVLRFNHRSIGIRCAITIAGSTGVSPVVLYYVVRYRQVPLYLLICILSLGFLFADFVVASAKEVRRRKLYRRCCRVGAVAVVAVAFATLSVSDIELPGRRYPSVVSYDYTVRAAVTHAIGSKGIPPVNPSFNPGRDVPLFYYYFWEVPCSIVEALPGRFLTARQALSGATVWALLALLASVTMYVRSFVKCRHRDMTRAIYIGMGLILVTGLDLIPYSLAACNNIITGKAPISASIEWWNWDAQVSAWLDVVLWAPHHVAALAAALFGVLVLLTGPRDETQSRYTSPLLAAAAFSSTLGLSAWVGLVVVATAVIWSVYLLVAGRRSEAVSWVLALLIAAALLAPFGSELRHASQLGHVPVALSVRTFGPLMGTGAPPWLLSLVLPVNYGIELGFFMLAGLVYCRYWRLGDFLSEPTFFVTMLSVSLCVCSVVRSNIQYNDLGWRGLLPAQFALLLMSLPVAGAVLKVGVCDRTVNSTFRTVCLYMIIIGVSGSATDVFLLRLYPLHELLSDGRAPGGMLCHDVAAAYGVLRRVLPGSVRIQHNPHGRSEPYHGLYGDRQVVIADTEHGSLFGKPAEFKEVYTRVSNVFGDCSAGSDRAAKETSERYGVDAWFIKDNDPIWTCGDSWVWHSKAIVQNAHVRVVWASDAARLKKGSSIVLAKP